MVSSTCAENKQNITSFDFSILKTNIKTSKTKDCNKTAEKQITLKE